jgi:hypothetical protein
MQSSRDFIVSHWKVALVGTQRGCVAEDMFLIIHSDYKQMVVANRVSASYIRVERAAYDRV